ncbi:MAG: hypothetical protein RLZZ196_772 [Bacteroidota bacterium]|jgi:hypothetical protein
MPKIYDTPELKRERLERALATISINANKHIDYNRGVETFFKNLDGWILECPR